MHLHGRPTGGTKSRACPSPEYGPVLGPAGTSLENNNVFTVQPNVYFEGMDPSTESASMYADESTMKPEALNPATVTVGIVALGIVAVAGSATAIYYEVGALLLILPGLVWSWRCRGMMQALCLNGCLLSGRQALCACNWGPQGLSCSRNGIVAYNIIRASLRRVGTEHVDSLKASANSSLALLFLLLLALCAECHWPCSFLGGAGWHCGRCWLQLRQQQADQG